MKRLMCAAIALLAVFMFSGCGTVNMRQGGVVPGFIYGEGTYPSMKDSYTKFQFDAEDIEVLGTVNGTGTSANILFLFSRGDNGYQKLLKEAKQKYPDMDALINFYWDTKYFNIAWPFPYLPLFNRAQSDVTATAIKFKEK